MSPRANGGSAKKSTNNLVALGSVAVLGVYAAGYARTAAAADRFAQAAQRHPAAVIARANGPQPAAVQPPPGVAAPPTHVAAASLSTTSDAPSALQKKVAVTNGAKPAAPSVAATPPDRVAAPGSSAPAKPSADSVAVVKATAVAAPPVPVRADPVPAKTVTPPADTAATASSAEKQRMPWKDGAYVGYGTSRHGDIEATIEIKAGKIISASISDCRTQYSCSWISALPPQVITRQSAEVDYVSGATQSSNAFYAAIVDALNKAK